MLSAPQESLNLLVFATLIPQEERRVGGERWSFSIWCDPVAILFLREASHNLKRSVTWGKVWKVGHLAVRWAKKSKEIKPFPKLPFGVPAASAPEAPPPARRQGAPKRRVPPCRPLRLAPRVPPRRPPAGFLPVSLPPPSLPGQWHGAVFSLPEPPRGGVG